MRSFLSNEAIARLTEEDVPYLDLTTFSLGIAQQPGRLEFYTRHPTVICATEEAVQVIETCGAEVQTAVASGTALDARALILSATGTAEALHIAWRVALNLMEYTSGIATRTADLVKSARAANPNVSVVTTRKSLSWDAIADDESDYRRRSPAPSVGAVGKHSDFQAAFNFPGRYGGFDPAVAQPEADFSGEKNYR